MDFVAFRARSLPSLWRRAVGALLDSVLHVHFDSNLVRAEQAVMRQMEGEANAAPAIVASRTGIQALYPAIERCGHPLVAWRPAATAYIRRFCQRNFRPNRITLTVSGPVDKEDVVAFVERATANLLPAPSGPSAGAPAMPARVGRKRLRVDGEGAAVWIGARMPRPSEADYPAAVVAAAIIGGGMGSRAFRRLRDDLSLAYTVGAQMVASDCCPHAFVLCMCRPADADRAADELNAQIDDLIAHGPKAWEVDRAREYCAAEAAQLAMSNWQAAAFIGAMAIMADRMPWIRGPSALSQAVRAVSMTDVQRIIRNWWARRATIVVVGK